MLIKIKILMKDVNHFNCDNKKVILKQQQYSSLDRIQMVSFI